MNLHPRMTPALDPQLDLVLRAAVADRPQATAATHAFIAGFEPDLPLDPRVYAAVPAVYARMVRTTASDDPHWRLIAGVARQTWTRNQIRLSAAQSALDSLERVGVVPLVLPGAVTAMAALDDPVARVLERIDLLVPSEHVPRVAAALLAGGATIRQDHAALLDGRLAGHFRMDVDLADGALVVRWDHRGFSSSDLGASRARVEPLHLGSLSFVNPAPGDTLVAALADLSETDTNSVAWTNLFLEVARLRRVLGSDRTSFEHLARAAQEADRHDAWATLLRLLAHLTGDQADAEVAERFAAIRQEHGRSTPGADGTAPRSPPGRALRMVRQYRGVAAGRNEPVTIRGLARYLKERWQLEGERALPREVGRRLVRARRPQPASGPGDMETAASGGNGSARNSSATLASRTPTE